MIKFKKTKKELLNKEKNNSEGEQKYSIDMNAFTWAVIKEKQEENKKAVVLNIIPLTKEKMDLILANTNLYFVSHEKEQNIYIYKNNKDLVLHLCGNENIFFFTKNNSVIHKIKIYDDIRRKDFKKILKRQY